MNKLTLTKYISLVLASAASFIISLVLFIKSFYYGDYGADGSEFTFSEDYTIALVVSLILLFYSVYRMIMYIQMKSAADMDDAVGATCATLVSFYSLGIFFKALGKATANKKSFDFAANQNYLYIGIVVLFLVIYYVAKIFETKKVK